MVRDYIYISLWISTSTFRIIR